MPIGDDLLYIINVVRQEILDFQDEVTGSLAESANAIVDIWEIDCHGEWVVWVKTGAIAAGKALWMIITPSFEEILENYLEPKPGRRGGRRGQSGDRNRHTNPAGQRRLFFRGGIPDLDNAIADLIPGREIIAGRRVGPGEHIFWTGINVADRILWYWLLIEATRTFTTTWVSGLLESGKCASLNNGEISFTAPQRYNDTSSELWKQKSSLIGLSENNLFASNNSGIRTQNSHVIVNGLVVCSTFWYLQKDSIPGETTFEVTISVYKTGYGGTGEKIASSTGTITAGPDQLATTTVDVAVLAEDFNQIRFEVTWKNIVNNSYTYLSRGGQVSIASRNARIV